MAEFARLFPRTILDSELAILIRDKTAQVYGAVSEVIAETSAVLTPGSSAECPASGTIVSRAPGQAAASSKAVSAGQTMS